MPDMFEPQRDAKLAKQDAGGWRAFAARRKKLNGRGLGSMMSLVIPIITQPNFYKFGY